MADFEAVARRFWHPVARSLDVGRGQVVSVTLLDPRDELQLPCDRLSVVYRRRLADIGFPARQLQAAS